MKKTLIVVALVILVAGAFYFMYNKEPIYETPIAPVRTKNGKQRRAALEVLVKQTNEVCLIKTLYGC